MWMSKTSLLAEDPPNAHQLAAISQPSFGSTLPLNLSPVGSLCFAERVSCKLIFFKQLTGLIQALSPAWAARGPESNVAAVPKRADASAVATQTQGMNVIITPGGSSGSTNGVGEKIEPRLRVPLAYSSLQPQKNTTTESGAEEGDTQDNQREKGYIVGAAFRDPGFEEPGTRPPLEDPPIFLMENVSLSPLLRTRKPVQATLSALTAQLQKTAIEYCSNHQLNCSEEHALQTAISLALRTSTVASMFRRFSASLSAVEVGFSLH